LRAELRRPAAGDRFVVVARVQPPQAGGLHLRVERASGGVITRTFRTGRALLPLTPSLGTIRVRVETLPRPDYAKVGRFISARAPLPRLVPGSVGPLVGEMLRRLSALGYAVARPTSGFGADVVQSVYAFQKAQRLPRTGSADEAFWRRLERPLPAVPRYRQPGDHLEIDKARQILLVVRDGSVRLISPVSTAGIAGYYTPVGRFAIYRKVPGYDPSPLGVLLSPMYFLGGYAIHGNPSVPPYPASHGCIRVPNFVIARLFSSEPYGETVYVY
jgi:hypothetical protein